MILSDIKEKYFQRLSGLYPEEEINSIFEIAAEDFLGMDRISLHQGLNKNTSPGAEKKMLEVLNRLMKAEPIQYISGQAEFLNIRLKLNKEVLIPRQETEYLASLIIKENAGKEKLDIIDLCTGSGCLAIALSKNLIGSSATGIDISSDAISLATKNGLDNGQSVTWIQDDMLKLQQRYGKYDIIVSNPPYVRNSEKSQMHKNVMDYEPHKALFVEDDDPLLFYRSIMNFAREHLRSNGKLFLEINQYLSEEMTDLFREGGFRGIKILKDLNENSRFLTCIA